MTIARPAWTSLALPALAALAVFGSGPTRALGAPAATPSAAPATPPSAEAPAAPAAPAPAAPAPTSPAPAAPAPASPAPAAPAPAPVATAPAVAPASEAATHPPDTATAPESDPTPPAVDGTTAISAEPAAAAPDAVDPTAGGVAVGVTVSASVDVSAPPEPAEVVDERPYVRVGFNAGLVPGLSINAAHRGERIRNAFSLSLLASRAAVVDGLAFSAGVNIVDEAFHGVSAGFVGNIDHGEHHGAQISALFNAAEEIDGGQFGFVNWGRTVRGAQVGFVNAARKVSGVQLGVINVAEEADVSIALIPYTKKGGVRIELFSSDTAMFNLGIRLPANYSYAFASVGMHPITHERSEDEYVGGRGWEFGGGWGGHVPIASGFAFIDLDLGLYGVVPGLQGKRGVIPMARGRLLVGLQPHEHLAIYAGPTANVLVDPVELRLARPGYGWVTGEHREGGVRVRTWPGFTAGLRF